MMRACFLIALVCLVGAVEPLTVRLASQDSKDAAAALTELAKVGIQDRAQHDLLHARLGSRDEVVRLAAIEAISRLRDDDAAPELISILKATEGPEHEACVRALTVLFGSNLGGDDAKVWQGWYESYEQNTAAGVATMLKAVQAGDPDQVRLALAPLLRQTICRDQIIDGLLKMAESDDPQMMDLARDNLMVMNYQASRLALSSLGYGPDGTELSTRPRSRSTAARLLKHVPTLSPVVWWILGISLALVLFSLWWYNRCEARWRVSRRAHVTTRRFVRKVQDVSKDQVVVFTKGTSCFVRKAQTLVKEKTKVFTKATTRIIRRMKK